MLKSCVCVCARAWVGAPQEGGGPRPARELRGEPADSDCGRPHTRGEAVACAMIRGACTALCTCAATDRGAMRPPQVLQSDTVAEMKRMIAQQHGIPVDQQRLLFSGEEVRHLASVHVVLPLGRLWAPAL